jgi:hypothetical protein
MRMWMTAIVFALAAAASLAARPALAEEGTVDLLLVLAADVSRSVDEKKFKLQRDGYVAAIADPRVVRAMTAGPSRPHRALLLRMGLQQRADRRHRLDRGRRRRRRPRRARARARRRPRAFMGRTSISAAIDYSMAHLARSPFQGPRRVIDVSGDGTNNSGRPVTQARDEAIAAGRDHQRPR